MGVSCEWGEALRLTERLLTDPGSSVSASVQQWDYPLSREALVLLDSFDLQHAVNSKKRPPPHSMRPWLNKPSIEHLGKTNGRSASEVRAMLANVRDGRPPV